MFISLIMGVEGQLWQTQGCSSGDDQLVVPGAAGSGPPGSRSSIRNFGTILYLYQGPGRLRFFEIVHVLVAPPEAGRCLAGQSFEGSDELGRTGEPKLMAQFPHRNVGSK